MNGIDCIHKEDAVRLQLLQILIWEISKHSLVILDHLEDSLDGELVDQGYDDILDLRDLESTLLTLEQLPHEVLVHVACRRQVVLEL